jgi:DivIVA domain-containing protein
LYRGRVAEGLTPNEIRGREFAIARRGYDRKEVAGFLDAVASRVESLEGELDAIAAKLNQLGITDLPLLKEEIADVGVEVQAVLDAALQAAERARTRAATDAEEMMKTAADASYEVRSDAWVAGTQLLEQADREAGRQTAQARDDALFIRAEAEQDAKRLVSEARRQADDMLRSSREDGERIVVIAKAESDAILEEARQAAEKAQERARALENRRTELLGELEVAEATIRDLETTRAERKAAADAGVRIIAAPDQGTHWPEDDGAVRILPAEPPVARSPSSATIDAEAMAAEVEQMRAAVTMPQDVEQVAVEVREVGEEPAGSEAAEDRLHDIVDGESQDDAGEKDSAPVDEAAPPSPAEPKAVSSPAKVAVVEEDSEIEELFARLRQPEPEPEPEHRSEPVADEPSEPEAPVERKPLLHAVPDGDDAAAFERRDRMLLPIENRGLRGLKRRIVELQNRVLEELRTSSGDFRLGRELVAEMMGDELDSVLLDSFAAGHKAAAETLGVAVPQLTGGPEQGAAELFTTSLHRDVNAVISREPDGRARRMSSDVGRVFRSWRTGEAERHVRRAARRAFNDGLVAGYGRLGVEAVELVAAGRPCGECGAGTGVTWTPGDELPDGVIMAPAGPGCAAIVTPAGRGDFG